jgi:hypothetical protein
MSCYLSKMSLFSQLRHERLLFFLLMSTKTTLKTSDQSKPHSKRVNNLNHTQNEWTYLNYTRNEWSDLHRSSEVACIKSLNSCFLAGFSCSCCVLKAWIFCWRASLSAVIWAMSLRRSDEPEWETRAWSTLETSEMRNYTRNERDVKLHSKRVKCESTLETSEELHLLQLLVRSSKYSLKIRIFSIRPFKLTVKSVV